MPFSQEPLPTEDPSNRDIPFPLLRYEEELLAGLLQLQQHQAGPVNSVEQLLAMQPQCVMPPDLAHHFQGWLPLTWLHSSSHSFIHPSHASPLIHALTVSSTHSLVQSRMHASTHSCMHPSVVRWFIRSFIENMCLPQGAGTDCLQATAD